MDNTVTQFTTLAIDLDMVNGKKDSSFFRALISQGGAKAREQRKKEMQLISSRLSALKMMVLAGCATLIQM